jgi:hypothetical protein
MSKRMLADAWALCMSPCFAVGDGPGVEARVKEVVGCFVGDTKRP